MQNNSFSGEVPNPIVDARLAISLSANGLAKQLGLSRQYVWRAEAGTYASLNPALLRWVANATGITTLSVVKRYQRFQQTRRRATIEETNPHKLERHNSTDAGYKLFERWRSGYWSSSLAFANAFCVHPETVRAYEEGIRPEMPIGIKTVLEELDLIEPNWVERPQAQKPQTAA